MLSDDQERPPPLTERFIRHTRIKGLTELENMYTFQEEIGKGSFSTVVAAKEKRNDRPWAIKIICKHTIGTRAMRMVEKEISILRMVNHPHIIYLDRIYECARNIYLIFELCRSSLAAIYQERKSFSENETKKIVKALVSAVEYLHKNSIVHRDLKLENILVTTNPSDHADDLYVKVSDFGLGAIKTGAGYEDMLHDWCGTLTYMSPEMILNQSYSQQTDIWALGVMTYMLLAGRFPFFSEKEKELKHLICRIEPSFAGLTASAELIDLMTRMLAKNPAVRITAAEISLHPWLLGTSIDEASPENVLDMMRLWRSEMMLPIGEECDWVVNSTNLANWSIPSVKLNASSNASHKATHHNISAVKAKVSGTSSVLPSYVVVPDKSNNGGTTTATTLVDKAFSKQATSKKGQKKNVKNKSERKQTR